MGFLQRYKLECKNVEGNYVKAIIEDSFSPETNPYGITWQATDDPGPDQTVTVNFTSLPAGCTGTRIDALDSNGNFVGSSGVLAATSPAVWNSCPDGNHTFLFFFLIPTPGDDEFFVLNEIENAIIDELTGSDHPFHLRSDNNSEAKLKSVCGTLLEMQFESTPDINLNKFLQGNYSDRRYRVTATIESGGIERIFFRGHLQLAESQEMFLPHPNTVRLTATCGLGSLKNKPLLDDAGNAPSGYYRLIRFIAFCLKKTGIEQNINVVMNIKESRYRQFAEALEFVAPNKIIFHADRPLYAGQVIDISGSVSNDGRYTITGVTVVGFTKEATVAETVVNESPAPEQPSVEFVNSNFFNYLYADAKTFEKEIGENDDCYTVLHKILWPLCRIAQRHGEWWIKNIDEYDEPGDYVVVFDKNGDWIENKSMAVYQKEIGFNNNMKWSQESCMMNFKSPAAFSKLTYRYENPAEVPCNNDLERGDYIADISAESKKYELECWDLVKQGVSGDEAPDTDGYLRRDFINGYEDKRYVVIEHDAAAHFFRSEKFPVDARGKIKLDMVRRLSADVAGSGFYRDQGMQVRLYANDGTFYMLQGETSVGAQYEWVSTNSSFTTNVRYLWFEGDVSRDMTEAESLYGSGTSPELPKAGHLQILIHQSHETSWNRDTYIDKIELEYYPLINGSHQKYRAHYHKSSQVNDDDVEKTDDEIYLSDAPARLLKGALHVKNHVDYGLAALYWNAAKSPAGPGGNIHEKPYGWHCTLGVWNQVRMLHRIFKGSVAGIESGSADAGNRCDIPTVLHHYKLQDADEQTMNRKFILLGFDMDLFRCEFSQCTVAEVQHEIIPKRYTDPYEFKYVSR